jgi:nucleotide-binding universal stress UspA family protein
MYKSILVPTDGSEFSDRSIEEAAKLAKELSSKLMLFYAVPHYHLPPLTEGLAIHASSQEKETAKEKMEAEAKAILASAAKNANLTGVTVELQFTMSNSPYEAIIEAAKKFQCELIIMGSHGRSGISGVLLGSVTQKVLTHSTIPVLVVR